MRAAPVSEYLSTYSLECERRSLRTQVQAVESELYKLQRRLAEVEETLKKRRKRAKR